jgi:FKBP-type peptidyl-prolyl cis-trans isomerase 2
VHHAGGNVQLKINCLVHKNFKKMQEAKKGDVVKVNYTGKLTNGEVFDSSEGREPLEFTVGAGQMIVGFDVAIPGMKVGDKKTINISAEEGYGAKNEEMVFDFPKERIPADMKLELGMQLSMNNGEGQMMPVTVVGVSDESIKLDANHFLAGKELVFDVELVSIG